MVRFFLIIIFSITSIIVIAQKDGGNHNPFVADPTIFFHKGVYYLYGTGGGAKDEGFKAFTSADGKEWIDKGYVLKKGQSFGSKGFWAPQVFQYKDKFYMAYTADEHIAIASADSPLGPFTQKELKPIPSTVRMIDPFVFFDNGKIYLYHVRLQKGNRIFVAEMNNDLTEIDNTTLKECINASEKWEDTQSVPWRVAEGPTVLRHNNFYYLIYSANDFRNPDYAIGYAVSKSPTGPWKKNDCNPILSKKDIGVNGTGHGDVFIGNNGKTSYVFHTHYSNEKVGKRRTGIIDLVFEKTKSDPDRLKAIPITFKFLQTSN